MDWMDYEYSWFGGVIIMGSLGLSHAKCIKEGGKEGCDGCSDTF